MVCDTDWCAWLKNEIVKWVPTAFFMYLVWAVMTVGITEPWVYIAGICGLLSMLYATNKESCIKTALYSLVASLGIGGFIALAYILADKGVDSPAIYVTIAILMLVVFEVSLDASSPRPSDA